MLLVFGLTTLLTPLLTLLPAAPLLSSPPARLVIFTISAAAGGYSLRAWSRSGGRPGIDLGSCLASAALLAAFMHIGAAYLQDVSTYPLTMTWSETSRYYYASLFFAGRIYGSDAPPTVLHPSRYLLQAVPFLLPNSPLWLHRLWQVLLWMALSAGAAWALARRVKPRQRWKRWLVSGAAFGYLMLGPVYYHLLVPVILLLGWFRVHPSGRERRILNTTVLLLASAWAGISRVNWYPVPGLLAAALILLERPLTSAADSLPRPRLGDLLTGPRRQQTWRYLAEPIGWTLIGTAAAFLAQVGYIAWSGNAAGQFTTSFTSDLLWSRLLPNPTYGPGILAAAVLVTLPPALIVIGRLARLRPAAIHPVRLLGLAAILAVLFAGGLVVSVKIGGGSNLHNLDAYLALLVVVGVYFACSGVQVEPPAEDNVVSPGGAGSPLPAPAANGGMVRAGAALAVAVIAGLAVAPRGPAEPLPDRSAALSGAATIAEAAEFTAANGGEVLFISNRHLLTFGAVREVALVPDYERVFLMEAAMAGDKAYLERFYADLARGRFGLIVSEPLSIRQKGAVDVFGAENDAWVRRVAARVLCYYEPVKTLRAVQVQLLVPRAAPQDCP